MDYYLRLVAAVRQNVTDQGALQPIDDVHDHIEEPLLWLETFAAADLHNATEEMKDSQAYCKALLQVSRAVEAAPFREQAEQQDPYETQPPVHEEALLPTIVHRPSRAPTAAIVRGAIDASGLEPTGVAYRKRYLMRAYVNTHEPHQVFAEDYARAIGYSTVGRVLRDEILRQLVANAHRGFCVGTRFTITKASSDEVGNLHIIDFFSGRFDDKQKFLGVLKAVNAAIEVRSTEGELFSISQGSQELSGPPNCTMYKSFFV